MSLERIKKLPTPQETIQGYDISDKAKKQKQNRDNEIREIFTGRSNKFIVIIGPCSADNVYSVIDYISRLSRISEKVSDKLILIPRIYTNKPRTTGEGYKGFVHQPDPQKIEDFEKGLIEIRKMHIRVIEETGLSGADEMLYPENRPYVGDLLSYEAVGARSVENQQHRLVASSIDIPVGMKNPTSGDFSVMLNSVYAAQLSHAYIFSGWHVRSSGNPLAHCVLRGGISRRGNATPNYHYEDLCRLIELYQKRAIANPAAIIDANHSNSNKDYTQQPRIIKEVLHSRRHNPEICNLVKGVMIESYIEGGCQKIGDGIYGKSITDPCLSWAESEKLIYDIADGI